MEDIYPNLGTPDFYFTFLIIETILKKIYFKSYEKVIENDVKQYFWLKSVSYYKEDIFKLVSQYDKCINVDW